METSKFLFHAIAKCGCDIERYSTIKRAGRDKLIEVPFCFIHQLHDLSKDINYHCDFDSKGRCKRIKYSPRCCCMQCYNTTGHHTHLDYGNLRTYAASFKVGFGFWRPKQGCILPRSLRSRVCIVQNCVGDFSIQGFFSAREKIILNLIQNLADTYLDYREWRIVTTIRHDQNNGLALYVDEWVKRLDPKLDFGRSFLRPYINYRKRWVEFYNKQTKEKKA